jgi:hypothetical protein
VLAVQPTVAERSANAAHFLGLGVAGFLATARDLRPQVRDVNEDAYDNLIARYSATPPPASVSPADAEALARWKYANDSAFARWGEAHATRRQATDLSGRPGRAVIFHNDDDPIGVVQQISLSRAAPSSTPTAQATPHNIEELAIFTHGTPDTIQLPGRGVSDNPRLLAQRLTAYLAPSVQIQIYGCSAASGRNSYLERLTEALAPHHEVRGFGHTGAGRADTFTGGREFVAGPTQPDATSQVNADIFFPPDFQQTMVAAAIPLFVDATAQTPPPAPAERGRARSNQPQPPSTAEEVERAVSGSLRRYSRLRSDDIRVGGVACAQLVGYNPAAAQERMQAAYRAESLREQVLLGVRWNREYPVRAP